MSSKTVAIIAHITIVGWVIAVILNLNEKSDFVSFYLRQLLGLFLLGAIGSMLPVLKLFVPIVVLILVILSLVGAIKEKKEITPFIGQYFQQWFAGL